MVQRRKALGRPPLYYYEETMLIELKKHQVLLLAESLSRLLVGEPITSDDELLFELRNIFRKKILEAMSHAPDDDAVNDYEVGKMIMSYIDGQQRKIGELKDPVEFALKGETIPLSFEPK
jgi:hypothetical protein